MSHKDRNHYRSFDQGRKNGWGIGLYRHPSDGWFGGVCAGLAEYWEVPTWVTRLSAFALFLFTGSVIFWFYIAAWILISKRSSRWGGETYEGEVIKDYDEDRHEYRRRSAFRYSEAPSTRMAKAHDRVREAERKIAAMERYVTSSRYDLDKEFSKL
jgi:phage shock protein C